MKKPIPLLMALALLLTACGVPPAEPTPTPDVIDVSTEQWSSTPSDIVVHTPIPRREGESRYASYVRNELKYLRESEYTDDESKILNIVTMYMDLWYERMYNLEYTDYSVFDSFFDETAEGYPHLQYNCMEARYLALMEATSGDPVAWYDYDIDIESVELDGDTAVAEVHCWDRCLHENYNGMSSGLIPFWITLEKTDGVWFMTDISPDSIYGTNQHGSYEELLGKIDELEAEYESITQMR